MHLGGDISHMSLVCSQGEMHVPMALVEKGDLDTCTPSLVFAHGYPSCYSCTVSFTVINLSHDYNLSSCMSPSSESPN